MNAKHARVVSDLDRAGITAGLKVLDQGTHTAADYLGCEEPAIANSLVFDCEGEPLLSCPAAPAAWTRGLSVRHLADGSPSAPRRIS
ncbi:hypothetical protein [Arthrobacter sp. AQ5-05]|uniref:hypothetical protein n=1 Tax=Arthrobacter sp. AQ5-05 TaxID=2184581 RepID=UPI0025701236|nr:hypothetical protein [Arthrobacter sp. AQ5-05]